jgi:hypothetical protein
MSFLHIFVSGPRALDILKLNGIIAMLYYLGCIFIFWNQNCLKVISDVVGM